MFQSILNQTNERQEKRAYEVLKQLCEGKDLESKHLLRKLKLNADEEKGRAWAYIPALVYEFGLWQHTIKQIYCSFLNGGANGASGGIVTLCITDSSLCGLIRRYSTEAEIQGLFHLPIKWEMCKFYKHEWCIQENNYHKNDLSTSEDKISTM